VVQGGAQRGKGEGQGMGERCMHDASRHKLGGLWGEARVVSPPPPPLGPPHPRPLLPLLGPHQAHELLGGEQVGVRRELHPLLRHAVGAAQVAALRQADAQVGMVTPGWAGGWLGGWVG
jgi:hypothetical protein